MAEKTPSGFDIEPPTTEELAARKEEKKKPYVNPHRSDPTLPCFQIALHQEEKIAAFLQRFKKVPPESEAAAAAGEEKDAEDSF